MSCVITQVSAFPKVEPPSPIPTYNYWVGVWCCSDSWYNTYCSCPECYNDIKLTYRGQQVWSRGGWCCPANGSNYNSNYIVTLCGNAANLRTPSNYIVQNYQMDTGCCICDSCNYGSVWNYVSGDSYEVYTCCCTKTSNTPMLDMLFAPVNEIASYYCSCTFINCIQALPDKYGAPVECYQFDKHGRSVILCETPMCGIITFKSGNYYGNVAMLLPDVSCLVINTSCAFVNTCCYYSVYAGEHIDCPIQFNATCIPYSVNCVCFNTLSLWLPIEDTSFSGITFKNVYGYGSLCTTNKFIVANFPIKCECSLSSAAGIICNYLTNEYYNYVSTLPVGNCYTSGVLVCLYCALESYLVSADQFDSHIAQYVSKPTSASIMGCKLGKVDVYGRVDYKNPMNYRICGSVSNLPTCYTAVNNCYYKCICDVPTTSSGEAYRVKDLNATACFLRGRANVSLCSNYTYDNLTNIIKTHFTYSTSLGDYKQLLIKYQGSGFVCSAENGRVDISSIGYYEQTDRDFYCADNSAIYIVSGDYAYTSPWYWLNAVKTRAGNVCGNVEYALGAGILCNAMGDVDVCCYSYGRVNYIAKMGYCGPQLTIIPSYQNAICCCYYHL